jgi:uncharacterized lipoprotein YajG
MIRKAFLIASILGLSGCSATQPSRTLTLTVTPATNTQPQVVDRSLQFSSQDLRPTQYIALIDNETEAKTPLSLTQNLRVLLSSGLKQQLTNQGYTFNNRSLTKMDFTILDAVVFIEQDTLKHKLAGNMQWQIVVTTPKGKLLKRFNASSEIDGALKATNRDIEALLNRLIHRLLNDVQSDTELNAYLQGKQ